MTDLKKRLFEACEQYVEERIARVEKAINDLEDALKLETKCSMGDKYETGRAMLHLEFEKLSGQHEQYRKLRKTIRMMPPGPFKKVTFGSAVETSAANYYISIPAGELKVGDKSFYAVGAASPIAQALSGKKLGENVTFGGKQLKIISIL
ncbi:MAG: transcription elongation factor [Salinimicrobium sp.]